MACWKAPGLDKIHGFWHKAFPRINSLLRDCMWKIMDGINEMPDWVVRGRTVMIPKDGFIGRADQYRPITCLNISYKLMTATLAGIILEHASKCEALPREQKALRKGTRGCLDALTIDQAVADEAKKDRRDLSVAWVDYRKAYDLVPHRWINQVLRAVAVPKPVRETVKQLISKWATNLCLWTENGPHEIPIKMKRGIFQGDSLSPLLFCLCVAPLSEALRKTEGFEARHQASR